MDGLRFVRAVPSEQRWNDMTVIMVSSGGARDSIVLALTAGVYEYLVKPFDPQAVVDTLNLYGLPRPSSSRGGS